MRILLDECLPKDFAQELPGHSVKTVPQAGWASISNGKLLRLIADSKKFDLFLTVDKQLPHENRSRIWPFAIVILRLKSNRMIHVFPFAPEILRRVQDFRAGHVYFLTQQPENS